MLPTDTLREDKIDFHQKFEDTAYLMEVAIKLYSSFFPLFTPLLSSSVVPHTGYMIYLPTFKDDKSAYLFLTASVKLRYHS